MLNREQRLALVSGRHTPGCLFSRLPRELILIISTSAQDKTKFNTALHHAAFGELKALRTVLEKAKKDACQKNTATSKQVFLNPLKELLFNRGQTVAPGGLTIKHTTLLEYAFLSGDPEMVAMIKPYFSEVKGGEEEMEKQLARCRPCIEAMTKQQPEDLTGLFDIIKKASAQDVAEELKTGDQYEKAYQSTLRDALNQWRQAKLDPANRVINVLKAPRMHCNYQNWIHVDEFLDNERKKNNWEDLVNVNNYDKLFLILRQLRGFLELLELPVCERFAFARARLVITPLLKNLERLLKYRLANNSFPRFHKSLIDSHSGLGFDFYVSIFGRGGEQDGAERRRPAAWTFYKPYVEQKLQNLQNLCGHARYQNRPGV